MIRVQDLPPPSRFMFWCIAPFLIATIVVLPLAARPPKPTGWIILGSFVLLCFFALLGFWNAKRFWWCWRAVGGIVAAGYLAYLISMIANGQWFGDGRTSSASAFSALLGFIAFGYPGFMYAVFGRFSWKPEPEYEDYIDEFSEFEPLYESEEEE